MELTQKDKPFNWSPPCKEAFQELKRHFIEEPILHIPKPLEPFQVKCDTLKVATGAVLQQQDATGFWYPCAYLLKLFTPAERNYQIFNRELLAVVQAFNAW